MPKVSTTYDLLISCPSDVNGYVDIIKDCVESFNKSYGELNNIIIKTKHWSTDSYPESGDKPQNLLNKQLVEKCDAAVAIFWTKFGTPTDKYGSGTEEEIEAMLASKKQVFMYFLDIPIEPSKYNSYQYNKIQAFKEKYKGIYFEVKNKDDLKKLFSNHLALHFLKLVSGEKNLVEKKTSPILKIQSISQDNNFVVQYYNLLDSKLINEKRNSIISQINLLKQNCLNEKEFENIDNNIKNNIIKNTVGFNINKILGRSSSNLPPGVISTEYKELPVKISDDWKIKTIKFAKENNIEIVDNFWNIGNLKERIYPIVITGYNNTESKGTNEEIERYNSIKDLYWAIVDYYEYISFFEKVEKQGIVSLTLANIGNTFDEDIDVKISIKKNHICKRDNIPIPESNQIEEILKMHFLDYIYKINCNDIITAYTGYSKLIIPKIQPIFGPFNKPSAEELYNLKKKEYKEIIEHIFCYDYYTRDDMDILKFHIDKLKHNTVMAFPSVLVFEEVPDSIDYEISSKYVDELVKGKIKIQK